LIPYKIDRETESPGPSSDLSSDSDVKRRIQTVYDAVAGRSLVDRFAPISTVQDKAPGSRGLRFPIDSAAPETVLAHRWLRQSKKRKVGLEDDPDELDTKLMQAGLIVPSLKSKALPDSVSVSEK
jgi:hypothetical protein